MNLLDKRKSPNNEELLQQRFIARILREEGGNIDQEQIKTMVSRGFSSSDWFQGRSFSVNDTILSYEHLKKHRFVDMSTRQTKNGKIRKVSHPIHNRILFAHANNIVRRLSFEYTSRMKAMIMAEFPSNI